MRTWLALAALALIGASGCDMYFGDGDDDPCVYNDYGGTASGGYGSYHDPSTNTCIPDGGYTYPCDDKCGRCPATDGPSTGSQPDMGLCESQCTGLSEAACQTAAGCQAAYFDDPTADGKRAFSACYQTAPSGPVQGICEGLDAHECSRHDDCSLVYSSASSGTKFIACASEPHDAYCVDNSECGEGSHCDTSSCYMKPCPDCGPNCGICYEGTVCYGLCVPDQPSCAAVDCAAGYHCEEQCHPADGQNGPVMAWCETACVPDGASCTDTDCGSGYTCVDSCEYVNGGLQCGAQCVPSSHDPGSCYGSDSLCDATPPACPTGTTPGVRNGCWTGYCIPNADCGPNDPGDCTGTVTCTTAAPACPSDTTAGIANGCYTGYCIPAYECAAPACETLSTEMACTSRDDCTAVYTGANCTCYPNGCTCETLTFDRCETL